MPHTLPSIQGTRNIATSPNENRTGLYITSGRYITGRISRALCIVDVVVDP